MFDNEDMSFVKIIDLLYSVRIRFHVQHGKSFISKSKKELRSNTEYLLNKATTLYLLVNFLEFQFNQSTNDTY